MAFVGELATIFEVAATFHEAVFISTLSALMTQLQSSLQLYSVTTGFQFNRLQLLTHAAGSTNDAVITRCVINDSQLSVSVVNVGL